MRCPWRLLPVLGFLASCASEPTVAFQTDGKAKVAIVDWDNLEGEGKPLGETPLTVNAADATGKVVRISQDKKVPQYWVVSCDSRRDRLEAKIKMTDVAVAEAVASAPALPEKGAAPVPAGSPMPPAVLNKSHRLLLQAYEALVSTDYKLARQLADQLSVELPNLASPFIIIGLSYLQSGDREQARGAFSKAMNLDPEDQSTKELLQLTQF